MAPEEVLKTVFATAQGEATRVTDTQDGALFAARVDKVIPSAIRPLAEIRAKAVAAWQAEQRQKDAAKQAETLAAAATPAAPLATVAAERGLKRAIRRYSRAHAAGIGTVVSRRRLSLSCSRPGARRDGSLSPTRPAATRRS